ncbi:prolyl oligopeptidase family serine peptidase [Maricaulis sp.]|uniref:alpha/beta hydrolase family protein n=1 Tax=Maricaulis sp. TaxID=1486257 RepID=UPI00262732BB|nr:prolyl oligopeptidase family serine peptidase [Maricaulis sp.]MDF1768908.1 prolyl oligopeptidase family serine peptidase [Maricaulis sp.]
MKNLFDHFAAALAVGLLGAVGMPAFSQEVAPLTAADYAGSDDIAEVQVSPDGSQVAYIGRGEEHNRTIVVMTIGDEGEPLVVRPTRSGGLTHLRFLSDNHLWLQLGEHGSVGRAFTLVSSYVLNTQTRQFTTMPANSQLALAGGTGDGRVRVWTNPFSNRSRDFYDRLSTGVGLSLTSVALDDAEDVREILRPSDYTYVLDGSGAPVARVRFAENGRDTAEVWSRARGEGERRGRDNGWRSRFSESPEVENVLRFDGRRWDEMSPVVERVGGLGGAGRYLYFASRTDGTPQGRQPGRRLAVFRLDLENGNTEGPLVQSDVADVDGFILDWRTNEVVGVQWFERRLHTVWFDPDLGAIHDAVSARFPDHDVRLTSWDRDGDTLVVRLDGNRTAGRYYLLDANSGELTLLGAVRSRVPDDRVHPVRTVDYTSSDGLEQFAYLTTPRDREVTDLPLVLLAHKGPGYRDHGGFDFWAQFLASQGYAVLQPQYRGSAGFGTDYAQLGRGAWGGSMYQDLMDALDQVVREGVVDAGRVCLMGGGHGGHAALLGAVRSPDRVRCAIAADPIVDMTRRIRAERRGNVESHKRDWAERVGGDDAYDRDRLRAISPVENVDTRTPPILIYTNAIRGRSERMDRMEEALEDNDVAHFVVSVMETPGWWQAPNQTPSRDIMASVGRFLDEYNPAFEAEP